MTTADASSSHSNPVKHPAERPAPWVRLAIVNFNAGALLADCIAALAAQTDRGFEAVIVDNASTDGSADNLSLPDRRFTLLQPGENLGFAAGSNLGLRGGATEWVGTLNPDAIPDPGWLAAMAGAIAMHPDVSALGSSQIDLRDPSLLDGCGDCYSFFGINWRGGYGQRFTHPLPDGECFSPCGAAALYRRGAFQALGGFDETYFCYCEDVDLGFRLRLRGGRAIQAANAIVRHAGSATSGATSDFTLFHGTRNRLWTFVKNMPAPLFWAALPVHAAATLYVTFRHLGACEFRPMWRGLVAGVRGLRPILAERRRVQRGRSVSLMRLSAALSWNIAAVRRRAPDLKKHRLAGPCRPAA